MSSPQPDFKELVRKCKSLVRKYIQPLDTGLGNRNEFPIRIPAGKSAYLAKMRTLFPYPALDPLYAFYEVASGIELDWAMVHPDSGRLTAAPDVRVPGPKEQLRSWESSWQETLLEKRFPSENPRSDLVFPILQTWGTELYLFVDPRGDFSRLMVWIMGAGSTELTIPLSQFLEYFLLGAGLISWLPSFFPENFPFENLSGISFSEDFNATFPGESHPLLEPHSNTACPLLQKRSPFSRQIQEWIQMHHRDLFQRQEVNLHRLHFGVNEAVESPFILNNAVRVLGQKADPDFLEFFCTCNGIQLHWDHVDASIKDEEDPLCSMGCLLQFPKLEEICGGKDFFTLSDWKTHVYSHWAAEIYPEEAKSYESFLPLMRSEYNDVFFRVSESGTIELAHEEDGKFKPLGVDFKSFIYAFFQSRGVSYFVPHLVANPNFFLGTSKTIPKILKLFPGADLQHFRSVDPK